MNHPDIKIFPTVNELATHVADTLETDVSAKPGGHFFTVALSGGSTPRAIFQNIAEHQRSKINWSKLAFFWGDERCVSPDDPDSNFRMTRETLLKYIHDPEMVSCRIRGEDDPAAEALRYSGRVDVMLAHHHDTPQFDLFLLGLGEDGHTASIFPDNIGLFHSDKLFEPSVHPATGQHRITATGRLINNAREVWFIATGAGKAERVAQIIHRKPGWEKLPASLVQPSSGKLVWLLDEAAAAGLYF